MLDEKQVELIHHEVDGINSEQESARLEELLATNAEARLAMPDFTLKIRILTVLHSYSRPR